MPRYFRKLALLAKLDATYGVDPTPSGAANAILATNVTFTPIEGEEVSRDLMLPYLGNSGFQLANTYAKIEFEVEIAGAGAAGTAPAYGPLLRACGMAEVITAGSSVVYNPVSGGYDAVTMYANWDGVRHIMLGGRGNVKLTFTPGKIPRYQFSFMCLHGAITDAALPATTLTAFIEALVVSKANTPTFTIHGASSPGESLTIDLGQKTEGRFLIGYEGIEITDRNATGTAVVEARPLATVNWFAIQKARTRDALQLIHGTEAGNIVQVDAPAVQIGKVAQGNTQGILNYSLPLVFCPVNGNDELTITVK